MPQIYSELPNQKLFLICLLHICDKEHLYIPQFEPLEHVAFWLEHTGDHKHEIPTSLAPDICASCLHVDTVYIAGGRVRERCNICATRNFSDRFFQHPWSFRFVYLLNISYELHTFYMAWALKVIKDTKETHECVKQIQPNIQSLPGTTPPRARRFSFLGK